MANLDDRPVRPEQRLLRWAPLAALSVPAGLLLWAAWFAATCEGLACVAGVVLIVPAAPTTIVFGPVVGGTAAIVLGLATSLPLWALAGRWLARRGVARAAGAPSWAAWWARYVALVAVYLVLVVAGLVVVSRL